MSLVAKKPMNGWRPERNGREFTVVPDETQGGPKLSDTSKRRESMVFSTDGGERRVVDRWGDKESQNRMHGETCRKGNKETPKICLMSGREARNSESRGER